MAGAAVSGELLATLRRELSAWVEESRGHQRNYGETRRGGVARFDLEAGHRRDAPRLRRVNNPAEISESYRNAAFDAPMADMVAALIGPDVKFFHSKINLKQPGTATRVAYHQDLAYAPHTNEDMVTALLLLDDMTLENGCLMVVPGSHRQGQVSLWRDDVFTGQVAPEKEAQCGRDAVPILGTAGNVCLMHGLALHGSEPNSSQRPRGLYICVYTAADAFPLEGNSLPDELEGRIVRGRPTRTARLTEGRVELRGAYRSSSFFQVQGQPSAIDG